MELIAYLGRQEVCHVVWWGKRYEGRIKRGCGYMLESKREPLKK